ncbi:MAG: alpha/beta fold hydrolase [Alphaproteobacteria bacterium]|nr:alpha/beta fold hydrolase [Alphaproteobacteria bacterium]
MREAARSATIDGRTVAWREAGDGPALVLVHGIGGSAQSWAPQFERFAAAHRVIAWDAPGYGGSEPLPDARPTADRYAGVLLGLLDRLDIERADLIGHSIGAMMVGALCRRRQALARHVVLVHPIDGGGRLPDAERATLRVGRTRDIDALGMAAFAAARAPSILGKAAAPDAVATVVRIMAAIPAPAYRQLVEVIVAGDLLADLPAIAVPALVIAGGDDPVAPVALCRSIAAALPAGRLTVLDGIGHYLPLEDPARFDATVAPFLADTGP